MPHRAPPCPTLTYAVPHRAARQAEVAACVVNADLLAEARRHEAEVESRLQAKQAGGLTLPISISHSFPIVMVCVEEGRAA